MAGVGDQFRQRTQHEGVFEDIGPRQGQTVAIEHGIADEQQVEIHAARGPLDAAIAPAVGLDPAQRGLKIGDRLVAVEADHQIDEVVTVEADRRTAIGPGDAQRPETGLEQRERPRDMGSRIDVAADADEHRPHEPRSRVMRTPTPAAPRSACGLFTRRLSR